MICMSTIVCAHRQATGIKPGVSEELGLSRGGVTTRIHDEIHDNGLRLHVAMAGCLQHDGVAACALLEKLPKGGMNLADKPWDATETRIFLSSRGGWTNIQRVESGVTQSAPVQASQRDMRNTLATCSPSSNPGAVLTSPFCMRWELTMMLSGMYTMSIAGQLAHHVQGQSCN